MSFHLAVPCAVAFVFIAVVVLVGAGPAREVQAVTYSFDGVTWTPSLPSPLFDKSIRWVPGDSRSSQFHIFNDTDTDGRVQIFIESTNDSFAETLDVSVDGSDSSAGCGVTLVRAHERRLIDARVDMARLAGNDTQNAMSNVDLVVKWDNGSDALCSFPFGSEFRDRQEGA